VAATLRGRLVEAEPAGMEETTGFNLQDVTVIEADPEETSGFEPEGGTIDLDMPSAVAANNWIGKEVVVQGDFEATSTGERTPRWVFRVESIDET
jgi:hypothetical protein